MPTPAYSKALSSLNNVNYSFQNWLLWPTPNLLRLVSRSVEISTKEPVLISHEQIKLPLLRLGSTELLPQGI